MKKLVTLFFAEMLVGQAFAQQSEPVYNEWFSEGFLEPKMNLVNTVGGASTNAIAIEIPEAYDDGTYNTWDSKFCIYLKDNVGQVEGNDFSLSFDVYWESNSEADNAQIYLIFGKDYYDAEGEWINYTYDQTINTELSSEAGFWGVQNKACTVAKNEWTTVSWEDGITIGEKGEEQIGIRIDLAATLEDFHWVSNNTGNFYFKNIKVQFGENVLSFFSGNEIPVNNNYTFEYETNGSEATVTGIELTENVTTVTIPSTVTIEGVEYTVTAIGNEAFRGYRNLTSVTLPNTLTTIGDWAFYYCKNLTSMTIPNSVTSIGDYTFVHCENMTSITLPNTLTRISEEMFHSCYKLASITIPETVTSIGCNHA